MPNTLSAPPFLRNARARSTVRDHFEVHLTIAFLRYTHVSFTVRDRFEAHVAILYLPLRRMRIPCFVRKVRRPRNHSFEILKNASDPRSRKRRAQRTQRKHRANANAGRSSLLGDGTRSVQRGWTQGQRELHSRSTRLACGRLRGDRPSQNQVGATQKSQTTQPAAGECPRGGATRRFTGRAQVHGISTTCDLPKANGTDLGEQGRGHSRPSTDHHPLSSETQNGRSKRPLRYWNVSNQRCMAGQPESSAGGPVNGVGSRQRGVHRPEEFVQNHPKSAALSRRNSSVPPLPRFSSMLQRAHAVRPHGYARCTACGLQNFFRRNCLICAEDLQLRQVVTSSLYRY